MGNVYNSLTHSSHAAAAYAWAAAANPNNPDYLCNLAGTLQRQVHCVSIPALFACILTLLAEFI
jgi:hypothetical protein